MGIPVLSGETGETLRSISSADQFWGLKCIPNSSECVAVRYHITACPRAELTPFADSCQRELSKWHLFSFLFWNCPRKTAPPCRAVHQRPHLPG